MWSLLLTKGGLLKILRNWIFVMGLLQSWCQLTASDFHWITCKVGYKQFVMGYYFTKIFTAVVNVPNIMRKETFKNILLIASIILCAEI